MSTIWPEGLDTEYDEYDDAELYDDAEYDDSEYDDAESRASRKRKRARQQRARQVAQARKRAAGRRGAGRLPAPRNAAQQAVAAVRDLDLETKVVRDDFRSSDAKQSKRMSRSEYAAVASILINQGLETFGRPDNKILLAGIQASPLLLLAPERKGSGFEAVVKDPRIIGLAGVAGLVAFNELQNRGSSVKRIQILAPTQVAVDQEVLFVADVFDGRDRPSSTQPTWSSDPTTVLEIDPVTGKATGKAAGTAIVKAKAGDVSSRVLVQVTSTGGGHVGVKK